MRVLWTTSERIIPFASLIFLTPLAKWLRSEGVEVEIIRTGSLRSPWHINKAKRKIAAVAHKFDLIHSQYGSACALATMSATDKPRLFTIRGNDWNLHNETFHWLWLHTRLARLFSQMAIVRATKVCAVSWRIFRELQILHPSSKIHYLPTPVDFSRFRPATTEKSRDRLSLGIRANPDRIWVLFNSLNLWDPVKRYRLAREAIQIAKSKLDLPVELVLATGIPHEKIPQLTRACDVILSTSESEGWPNCIKEALASGVPFIATDTSDLRIISERDRRCQIVPPDAHLIADAIAKFIRGPRSHNAASLRDHVSTMQLPFIGYELLSIYREILGEHN